MKLRLYSSYVQTTLANESLLRVLLLVAADAAAAGVRVFCCEYHVGEWIYTVHIDFELQYVRHFYQNCFNCVCSRS